MALSNEEYTRLLDAFKAGNEKLEIVLRRYYAADNENERNIVREEILAICKEVLAAGDWQSSAFLRQAIAPVLETQEAMLEALNQQQDAHAVAAQGGELQEVFIALYQADGHNMAGWEMILRSLPQYMLGRPAYDNEEHVIAFVRSKADRSSEAYVKAYVATSALIDDTGAVRCDRLGQRLLNISQGALLVKNVISFHHLGISYTFTGKDLVKV